MTDSGIPPSFETVEEYIESLRVRAEEAEALTARLLHERKKREELEDRFRIAFQTSPDAVNINRMEDGVYIDINEGFTRTTGYGRDDVIGRSSLDINIWSNSEDRVRLVEELQQNGECQNLRARFVMKDGSVLDGLMSAKIITLDGEPHILSITRNISDMVRAQEQLSQSEQDLRASEQKYRTIVENAPILFVQTDADMRITYMNTSMAGFLGVTGDYAGQSIASFMSEAEFAQLTEKIASLSPEHPVNTSTVHMERESGAWWIHWTNQILHNADGTMQEYQGIGIDLTKRKEMEDQLMRQKEELTRLNRNLEQEVLIETERRRRQERVLFEQNKFAAMGQMISAIAHQWRQPLTALGLELQDIEDAWSMNELDQRYFERFTSTTMRLVLHMSETIDDFRNFFRTDELNSTFCLIESVQEVIGLVRAQLKAEKISFHLMADGMPELQPDMLSGALNGSPYRVYGSPGEFKQVVLNVVQNARAAINDHRQARGEYPGRIDIRISRTGEAIRVSIADSGCGITPAVRDRLFDPYFTTREEGQGTGIGLYMSRLIIEDHMGGSISAENGECGAVFVLLLPAAA